MDFLAGVLAGAACTGLLALLAVSGSMNVVSVRLKYLEEAIKRKTKVDDYDDSEAWKRGIIDDEDDDA